MPSKRSIATELVRLPRACVLAGLGYKPMLDLVMKGEVRGHQDPSGKWWVYAADARQLKASRSRSTAVVEPTT